MVNEGEIVGSMESLEGALFPYAQTIVDIYMMTFQRQIGICMSPLGEILEHLVVEPVWEMVSAIRVFLSDQLVSFLGGC